MVVCRSIISKGVTFALINKNCCVLCMLLTFLRLFTASVYIQREEDPTIILKYFPTNKTVFGRADAEI